MTASADYNKLAAMLLLAAGIGLIVWSTWGFVDRYYPHLLGQSADRHTEIVASAQNQLKPSGYNVNEIVSAHLFGKADQPVAKKTDNAPQTKLKLKLLGVLASKDEHYARAMIEVSSKGLKTYAIGESIEGTDAQLHKVENEKVILDRQGNLESLAMVREKTTINRNKPGTS